MIVVMCQDPMAVIDTTLYTHDAMHHYINIAYRFITEQCFTH